MHITPHLRLGTAVSTLSATACRAPRAAKRAVFLVCFACSATFLDSTAMNCSLATRSGRVGSTFRRVGAVGGVEDGAVEVGVGDAGGAGTRARRGPLAPGSATTAGLRVDCFGAEGLAGSAAAGPARLEEEELKRRKGEEEEVGALRRPNTPRGSTSALAILSRARRRSSALVGAALLVLAPRIELVVAAAATCCEMGSRSRSLRVGWRA